MNKKAQKAREDFYNLARDRPSYKREAFPDKYPSNALGLAIIGLAVSASILAAIFGPVGVLFSFAAPFLILWLYYKILGIVEDKKFAKWMKALHEAHVKYRNLL